MNEWGRVSTYCTEMAFFIFIFISLANCCVGLVLSRSGSSWGGGSFDITSRGCIKVRYAVWMVLWAVRSVHCG